MGEIEFGLDNMRLLATLGTRVHIPAGTTHWFRIGKGGAEMVSIAGRLGASQMFGDIAREIASDKPDLEKLVEIAARHEVTITV